MATENATSITELDPTRPASTEPVGEIDDHMNMIKGVMTLTFVDQPSDAWDDTGYLSVGPRQINGWEARITANEDSIALDPTTYALLSHFDTNGDVAQLLHGGVATAFTKPTGLNVQATAVGNTDIQLQNSLSARLGNILVNSAGKMQIIDATLGAAIELRGSVATANDTLLASFDPDGRSQLYDAGVLALASFASGLNVYDTNGDTPILRMFQDDLATINATFTANSAGQLSILANLPGRGVALRGRNTGDTADNTGFTFNPDAESAMYQAGARAAFTGPSGFNVQDPTSDGPALQFYESDGATLSGVIQFDTTESIIETQGNGLPFTIRGFDAIGAPRLLASLDPDGESFFTFNGDPVLRTRSNGIVVDGTIIDLDNSAADTLQEIQLRNIIGGAQLSVQPASGEARIQQTNAAGTSENSWITFARNGGPTLKFNGADKLAIGTNGVTVTGIVNGSEAPTAAAHLTRKDYVDARALSNTGEQRIEVQNMMMLTGRSGASVGSIVTVVFDKAFTSAPHVVVNVVNVALTGSLISWVRTTTTTGFTATVPTNQVVDWIAMGSSTN